MTTAECVAKLPPKQREENLMEFARKCIQLPPSLQSALVAQFARELQPCSTLGDFDAFIDCILPWKPGAEPFDGLKPMLSRAAIAPADMVRVLQRCVMNELYIPLVRRGEEGAEHFSKVALRLWEEFSALDEMNLDPIVYVKTKELADIFNLTRGMLNLSVGPGGPAVADIYMFCDRDGFQKKSAQKKIAYEALEQSKYYFDKLRTFTKYHKALAEHGGKVTEAIATMSSEPSIGDVVRLANEFRVWAAQLPQDSTKALIQVSETPQQRSVESRSAH